MKPKTWIFIGAAAGGATLLGSLLWELAEKKKTSVNPAPAKETDLKKLLSDLFVQQIIYSSSMYPNDKSELPGISARIQALQAKIAQLPKIQKIIIERKLKDTKEELQDSLDKIKASLDKIRKKWVDFGITAEAKKQLEIEMGKKLSMQAILEAALEQK